MGKFKAFEKKRTKSMEPTVTITKAGNIILNSASTRKFFQGYKYAKLFWDADGKRVGIKPLKESDGFAYNVNLSPNGNSGTFSGVAFCKDAGIDYDKTRPFPAKWNKEEGLLEFSVK